MILTIDYPEVILILWSFIVGFISGGALFASFFYRERKRMMQSIKSSQNVTIQLSEICDNLVRKISFFLEDLDRKSKKLKK